MRVETREIRGIISLSNTGRDCYVKYHQAGPGSIFKADDAEETSGQDHHPGHYRGLRRGRMAFYYHFKDIYDLVEWSCVEDASRALQGKKTYDTWHEGLLQIFEAVLENKPFILNAYRCISRDQMENFLFKLTYDLIRGVVDEQSQGVEITEEDKTFIAEFYKYSFVGILLDWIKQGMSTDYRIIAEKISTTMHGNVSNSIQNFARGSRDFTDQGR